MLETLRGRRAGEVRTMLAEDAGPGTAFLERRGYLPTWSRLDLRLEVAHLDLNRFDNLLESVKRRGFELVSVAELAADPQRNERLYELDWLLFQDVPMGQTLTRKPFKVWVAEELEDPTFEPDLSFVVLGSRPSSQPSLQNSDPLTGPYVGYSTLMRSPGGFFVIGMTGVRREVRGLGAWPKPSRWRPCGRWRLGAAARSAPSTTLPTWRWWA